MGRKIVVKEGRPLRKPKPFDDFLLRVALGTPRRDCVAVAAVYPGANIRGQRITTAGFIEVQRKSKPGAPARPGYLRVRGSAFVGEYVDYSHRVAEGWFMNAPRDEQVNCLADELRNPALPDRWGRIWLVRPE